METPTKAPSRAVLSQSNRRDSRLFSFRKNLSFDDPPHGSTSQHATTLFHTDSGYSSTSDSFISPFSSPVSNHGHQQHRSFHHQHTHSSLEPIPEDMESPCSRVAAAHELTPTTRHQLDRLNAFHITTPVSPHKKRAATTPLQSHEDASNIKQRRLTPLKDSLNVTPRKQLLSIPMHQSPHRSFRNSLDTSTANSENQPSFHSDRMEFSPIIGQRPQAFERKRSEHTLESSTPIDGAFRFSRVKGFTGKKAAPGVNAAGRTLRKTQSFSPSKLFQMKYSKETGRVSNVVLGLPSPKPLLSPMGAGAYVNPARKLLDFGCRTFDKLVNSQETKPTRPVLQRQVAVVPETELDMSLSASKLEDISHINPTTPVSSPTSNRSILSHPSIDLLLNSAIIPESPSFTPSVCHEHLLHTPKKQPTHHTTTSPARREANNILYAHLPCTPPKSASKRLAKRTTSAKKVRRSPAKRKLYEAKQPYVGMTRVDMLGRLEGVLPATDLIFRLLSTDDLVSCRQVSRRWCRIVESNGRALKRVERNARRQEVCKENTEVVSGGQAAVAAVLLPGIACGKSRVPFSHCNSLAGSCHGGAVTPPAVVSPKTRAFQDNQKIVKTITKSQRLMKCPRCQSTSIVDPVPPTSNSHDTPLSTRPTTRSTHIFRNSTMRTTPLLGSLAKHQSCPIPFRTPTSTDWSSLDDDSGVFGLSVDSHLVVTPVGPRKSPAVDVGQCTSRQCGFRFCVSCWRDYRGDDHNCTIQELGQQRHRPKDAVACSKQSKRNLRRLMVP